MPLNKKQGGELSFKVQTKVIDDVETVVAYMVFSQEEEIEIYLFTAIKCCGRLSKIPIGWFFDGICVRTCL